MQTYKVSFSIFNKSTLQAYSRRADLSLIGLKDANGGKCQINPCAKKGSKFDAKTQFASLIRLRRRRLECWNNGIMSSGAMEVVGLKKKNTTP